MTACLCLLACSDGEPGGDAGTGGVGATTGGTGSGGVGPSTGGATAGTGGVTTNTGGTSSGGTFGTGGGSPSDPPGPEDGRQIFLLIGQSNMEGSPPPQPADQNTNANIEVLGYDSSCQGRQWNVWSIASPPLHRCWAGLGPGDYFSRKLAEAWPNAKIGLVPCAISGVDIDFFRKGVVSARRGEFSIPPDNTASGAYQMVIERAQLAQQTGTIRGILFHQGESDSGGSNASQWVSKVAELVEDLRTDLNLGTDVPFIAGELYCCTGHNTLVHQLTSVIENAHVVSSAGLNGMDQYHFDLAGQRTLGERYAAKFLEALGQ